MLTSFKFLCLSLCALSLNSAFADELSFDTTAEEMRPFSAGELVPIPLQETPSAVVPKKTAPISQPTPKAPEVPFSPFTGRIKAKKVRIRLEADVDSRIIKEVQKDELISILGEKEDFWAVSPPKETKAYVFRSFVLDNVVEGNRVNVRLEPHLEAPVIAHLNSGDRLENAAISPINGKWLEITPPEATRFYIAKEYVEYAGGPELKQQIDRKMATCQQLLDAAAVLSQAELKKPFEEMDFDRIVNSYNTVVKEYSEFTELAETARQALTNFQEAYLEKRITYLESRSVAVQPAEQEANRALAEELSEALLQITDRMIAWEPVEEVLYMGWESGNSGGSLQEFYEDQKLSAITLSGIVESYNSPVKSKPGDFILRDKEIPIGYLYSTKINLQSLVGKARDASRLTPSE